MAPVGLASTWYAGGAMRGSTLSDTWEFAGRGGAGDGMTLSGMGVLAFAVSINLCDAGTPAFRQGEDAPRLLSVLH